MGSNFLIGLRTDNFVIMAADTNSFMHGALKMSKDHIKEYKLGERLYMVCCGELGDVDSFATWAKANTDLYARRNGYDLRPAAAHHWLRKSMAENLRSEDMWRVNCIIGGYDSHERSTFMSMIDHYATNIPSQKYLFAGFPGRFCYAIMDSHYKPDMTEAEGLTLVKRCIDEVKKRVIIDLTGFRAIVINEQGSRLVDGIKPAEENAA